MAAVSVVVATQDPGSALPPFLRAVDAQTLPAADFELVVVDASGDGSAARLQHLAGRRPNVALLTADAGTSVADRIGVALQHATGEYLLVVAQEQRLAPRALELLLDRARTTDSDLVLGRVVRGTGSGCAALPEDADRVDPVEVPTTGAIALVRRSLLHHDDPGAALLDPRALARDARTVGAVGRYACATEERGEVPPGSEASLLAPTYRWEEGVLRLAVEVRSPDSTPPALRAWLVASHDLVEVALPATVEPQGRVSAALDPRSAEGGRPLGDGGWVLSIRLGWPTGEATLPLPPGPSRPAVVDGRPYAVRAVRGAVQLDAGATGSSVVGRLPRSRASVAETVHGALVTLDYAELPAHGDAVLDGRLLLGGFGVPARLVCRDGRARLEAYVGSLPGTSPVAVVVGRGKPVRTGLRLRFDGAGKITFEDLPPAGSKPPPAGARLAQRLRRRLPVGLEPAVRRLAAVPVLRRAYRRLIRR